MPDSHLSDNFADEKAWLETLLRRQIPLAHSMDLRIGQLDSAGIRLDFPLAPSINDKGSAFGGALASAMILAGWSLPRLLLRRNGISADLVIGRCDLRFLKPVHGSYSAFCDWPQPDHQADFLIAIDDRGKGRLDLVAKVLTDGAVAASLEARYAALTLDSGAREI